MSRLQCLCINNCTRPIGAEANDTTCCKSCKPSKQNTDSHDGECDKRYKAYLRSQSNTNNNVINWSQSLPSINDEKQQKKRKSRKNRKRKYSSLVLVDSTNNTNNKMHQTLPLKKRKISVNDNTNNTEKIEYKTSDLETEEITEFNDDEFMAGFNYNNFKTIDLNVTNGNDGKTVIDGMNAVELAQFIGNKQEDDIPGDYTIDYGLIGGLDEVSSCKYHEKLIRYEQKQQYNEYKEHLNKLNKKLNNKNKKNELFEWQLIEYNVDGNNDNKQMITLNKTNKKKINYSLQQEMLLFCSCSLNHNYHGMENSFENILKCNQVLYGKIIDIQNNIQSQITISVKIKKFNASLTEYDNNYNTDTIDNEHKFHTKSSCLFNIESDDHLFFTFGLQLKAIETFYSSTTCQLGSNWCSKYFYINNDNNNNDYKSLITTNDILNMVESCELIKYLCIPKDVISLIVICFIGENEEYNNIKQLNHNFNDSQIKAIYNACYNDVSLIQGPPGCGKTFTAIYIVEKLFMKRDKLRIILTAHTHAACDQLLQELHDHFANGSNLNIIRYSNPSQIKMNHLKEYSYREKMKQHHQYGIMVNLFKEGRNKRMPFEYRQEQTKKARSLELSIICDVIRDSQIIVSTCYGCCKSVFVSNNISIDAIIIDEATQIVEPELLGCINLLQHNRKQIEEIKYWKRKYNAEKDEKERKKMNQYKQPFSEYITKIANLNKKLIMIGDPQQLSPVVRSKEAQKLGYDITLFDRLLKRISILQLIANTDGIHRDIHHNKDCKHIGNFVLLNKQYRGYEICGHEFCSQQFYGAKLQHDKIWNDTNPKKLIGGFKWKNNKPFNFVAINSKQKRLNGNYTNEIEANYIIKIVKEIINYGLYSNEIGENKIRIKHFEDIGIITPHKEQYLLLQRKLRDIYKYETAKLLAISTVDAFQGQQKSLIIYSMTRTDAVCNKFTTNYKRINVALTRAKFGLIIIGNVVQFDGYKVWKELHSYLSQNNLIKKY